MPGIIKAGNEFPALEGEPERPYFHLQDLEQRGEEYLAQVRQQAAEILAQAQAQVVGLRQKTIAAAKQESLEAVRQEMHTETQRRLLTLEPWLRSAIGQLQQQLEVWRMEWENRTVDLAVGIARKICRREFQQQPEIVLAQMEAALQLASPDDSIELRVHPTDLESFEPLIQTLIARLGDLSRTTMVSDPQVQVGGCLVRTKYGLIDAQLESQLARIAEELSP